MKEIHTNTIKEKVAQLCKEANYFISDDVKEALKQGLSKEKDDLSKDVINTLLKNYEVGESEQLAVCQDTGMVVVFFEFGQNVRIIGDDVETAINEGVSVGYEEGYLRKSVVKDPINRSNTKDNTPAVIHYNIVPGDKLKITVVPKGFGSENMSALKMLKPSAGIDGIKDFVVQTVRIAGANPCPPIVVGVGIGGTTEKAALMSKTSLLRTIGDHHKDPYWAQVEKELLEQINALGIGPAGFGGVTTALGVHINTYPTHIAGLPVAVNIGCHVLRHKHAYL